MRTVGYPWSIGISCGRLEIRIDDYLLKNHLKKTLVNEGQKSKLSNL
jgi:hypothetical protein